MHSKMSLVDKMLVTASAWKAALPVNSSQLYAKATHVFKSLVTPVTVGVRLPLDIGHGR